MIGGLFLFPFLALMSVGSVDLMRSRRWGVGLALVQTLLSAVSTVLTITTITLMNESELCPECYEMDSSAIVSCSSATVSLLNARYLYLLATQEVLIFKYSTHIVMCIP